MTNRNLDFARILSSALNHKENPRHLEERIQRTIQNLRDKGYIDFLGQGEYKLSKNGFDFAKRTEEKYPNKELWSAVWKYS